MDVLGYEWSLLGGPRGIRLEISTYVQGTLGMEDIKGQHKGTPGTTVRLYVEDLVRTLGFSGGKTVQG